MVCEIREITNRSEWESFLSECNEKTFISSWSWGEFQINDNNKIWRKGLYEGNKLIAVYLVIKLCAKRGTFLFVPHGPNIKTEFYNKKKDICFEIFLDLKKITKSEKAIFCRVAPIFEETLDNEKIFKDFGFKRAPIYMHAEVTWELDISASEEEILKGMRKTTRYLIKQAEKNPEIEIIKSKNIEDLKIFNNIYSDTVKRHKFVPFSLKYIERELNCFIKNNEIEIFLGKYKGEVVSSAIIIYWQGIGFYHHGASIGQYNNNKTPVSYLLQWEAIKEAKRRDCSRYNFWGIAPKITDKDSAKMSKHPWAGLSLFKMGFGGQRKNYVKTQDLIASPIYYLTKIFEIIRRKKRNL